MSARACILLRNRPGGFYDADYEDLGVAVRFTGRWCHRCGPGNRKVRAMETIVTKTVPWSQIMSLAPAAEREVAA